MQSAGLYIYIYMVVEAGGGGGGVGDRISTDLPNVIDFDRRCEHSSCSIYMGHSHPPLIMMRNFNSVG